MGRLERENDQKRKGKVVCRKKEKKSVTQQEKHHREKRERVCEVSVFWSSQLLVHSRTSWLPLLPKMAHKTCPSKTSVLEASLRWYEHRGARNEVKTVIGIAFLIFGVALSVRLW